MQNSIITIERESYFDWLVLPQAYLTFLSSGIWTFPGAERAGEKPMLRKR
jgi:hypothetical protein